MVCDVAGVIPPIPESVVGVPATGGAGGGVILSRESRRWLKEGSVSVMCRTDSTSSSSSLELCGERAIT